MTDVNPSTDTAGKVKVELHWESVHDAPTIYANQLLITHAGPEFYLVFGEVVPVGVDDPFSVPAKLTVKPKIRIAVSREIMPAFVEAMNQNLKNFMDRLAKLNEAPGQDHNDNA